MTADASQSRPGWIPEQLYPFESHFANVGGSTVHYLDEGSGPPLLLLHGNPTWSFLYREIVRGLRDRFRCIAPDLPGFGLSRAVSGYGFTPAEHAATIEQLVVQLDLGNVTMMVQDWGGPIGFWAAIRHSARFSAFVIGNTWAWPKTDFGTQMFSRILGGPLGGNLILQRNLFVERVIPSSMKLGNLSDDVMDAYRGPFPTPESRRPVYVFPREILASRQFLAQVEQGLAALRDRPALILWPTRDRAFTQRERRRWESVFPNHVTVVLEGAGHYIQEESPERIVDEIRAWSSARPRSA